MLSLLHTRYSQNSHRQNVSPLLRYCAGALCGLFLFCALAPIVSAHSATVNWVKSTDDTGATGSGYTIWRQTGACPSVAPTTTAGFTAVNSALAQGTSFVDGTVTPGTYCYVVTFTLSAAMSADSNDAAAVLLPAAPSQVTITNAN